MWISLVDSSLNGGLPCSLAAVAGAVADNLHSGPVQGRGVEAAGTACCQGSGKILKIPQDTPATKLDSTKIFTVCFANQGDTAATWHDSGIKLRVSKIRHIEAYSVNHKTFGTIPRHTALTIRYIGSVLNDRWLSLVDQTLNANDPCGLGTVAAAPKDSTHTGSRAATGNVIIVDTAAMSSSTTFAVCYAESGGITTSIWRDSGIRVKRSKVSSIAYGIDTTRFGVGFSRANTNRNTDDHNNIATDTIPQIADVKLEYTGELPNDMWISLIDDSTMDPDGVGTSVGNPCGYPVVAANSAVAALPGGTTYNARKFSGAVQAKTLAGGSGGKVVSIPQVDGNLLDATKTYAVCYAEGDGDSSDTTWADSYIRFKISKIETIGHHSALHTTMGHLPHTGSDPLEKLVLSYTGSLGVGVATNIALSIVTATANVVTTNSIATAQPCLDTSVATHVIDANGLYSGAVIAEAGVKQAKFDTTVLHTGTITGSGDLTKTIFALCYTEDGSAPTPGYIDSGIRLTIGKVQQIKHGTPTDLPYEPRVMKPVLDTMLITGLASAQNVIPQATNQKVTYVSVDADIIGGGLPINKYISLVDASLNANKPCRMPTIAAANADATHSGTTTSQTGTRDNTIPQTTLLDATKTYAVCYAITAGSVADLTWDDSYIRVTISKVTMITSIGVNHKVSKYVGHVAARGATESIPTGRAGTLATQANLLDIAYTGELGANKHLSLVDHTLGNLARFPCLANSVAAAAQDSQHSGAVQAGLADKTVLVQTDQLLTTSVFSVCYSEDGTTWYETGIRVKRSEIKTITTASQHASPADRHASSVFHSTNRIPQLAVQMLTYVGELPNDKWLSIVDASLNSNNPCVKGSVAATPADFTHSGVVLGRDNLGNAGGKIVTIQQSQPSELLDTSKNFAVCYSSEGAAASDEWQDSYIRYRITKLSQISHTVGKWEGYVGQLISHHTLGQLPNQYSGASGLSLNYVGSLATQKHVSFIDAELSPNTVHGIVYSAPCDDGTVAAASKDSVHSGTLSAATGSKSITTLDSTTLLTTKTYALCYAEGDGSATDGSWADSGIRFTFSRVSNVQLASGHAGINDRDMTSVFYMTNVLPQFANMELKYLGDLPTGNFLSLVDATLGSNNPCTDGSTAAANPDVYHSGVIPSATHSGRLATVPQSSTATKLEKQKIFAVCYSETGGPVADSTSAWYDSYIRLRISLVKDIKVGGITIRTFGQVPNVRSTDQYAFEYSGTLSTNKFLALVDESEGSYKPCVKSIAATALPAGQRSGSKQATSYSVKGFDTTLLETVRTFAVCYAEGDGSVVDPTWSDSGIRVTVPKIWNVLYSSGISGPSCTLPATGPVRSDCKEDTKARDMTSYPLATNVIPQVSGIQLEYVGTVGNGQYLSLVDVSLDANSNPCSNGAIAGGTANGQRSGPLTGGSNKVVTVPQNVLLQSWRTFAVCYDDSALLPPNIPSTRLYSNYSASNGLITPVVQGTAGGPQSVTWRDTFVRIRISKISTFSVSVSNMPAANTHSYTTIRTHGQIPIQAKGQQVHYKYEGSLAPEKFISLVDASLDNSLDTASTITRPNPCSVWSTASANADTTHSGMHQAAGPNPLDINRPITEGNDDPTNTILSLDTLSSGVGAAALDSSKIFALCYSENGLTSASDSGIRITVPKVTTVNYIDAKFGNPTAPVSYTRTMTSLIRATNKLPQAPGHKLVYDGTLIHQKWLSLIETTQNNGHPCLNPAVTAAAADALHSGSEQAATSGSTGYDQKTVTFPQVTLLNADKVFAVCYAETSGSNTDVTWRDSYIRLTMSKVEALVSYKITHRVTGQLPNHASLKVDYTGSLPNNNKIWLFNQADADVEILEASTINFPFPCASPPTGANVNSQVSGTAGTSDKIVPLDTTVLHSEIVFAVCYSETPLDYTSYVDSGIRVTVPAIYKVQRDSGYSGETFESPIVRGVPVREMAAWDQTSGSTIIDRPTNRFPQAPAQKLIYVSHSTNSAPDGKYISMVDASLNSDDPCVLGSTAAGGRATSTGTMSNVAAGKTKANTFNGRIVTIAQDNSVGDTPATPDLLDASKTFAVCYSLGDGTTTAVWKDTYVRLKLTKITSLITVGVTHQTFGQVPNTPAADSMLFEYVGSLANTRWLSLVDETVNPTANGVGHPCAKEYAAITESSLYSGSKRAGSLKKVTTFNTQILNTTKTYALCYSETTGDNADVTWEDSGIRVTVPRIWNMQYSSGATGPACVLSNGVLNTNCKLDTKPRDMTSKPLATNRLPQQENQILTYVGDMPANMYISLVDASLNNGNPCVHGPIAGNAILQVGGGGNVDERLASGPIQAGVNQKTVVIPQASNNLLNALKEFAVCYDEGNDISTYSTVYTAGTAGGTTSGTWRDSYIRLKLTKITSFDVTISNMPLANTFTSLSISTFGQIPNQAAHRQISYTYVGSLDNGKYVSLVDSNEGSELHTSTGITRPNPCEDATIAMTEGPADSDHTGAKLAAASTKSVKTLDTKTVGGTGLKTTKVYALCYSANGGSTPGSWLDSGIRITVPKLHTLQYVGAPAAIALRTRYMTSETEGTHKLPGSPGQILTYDGDLDLGKWVSIVDASENSWNPCVNPVIAGASASSTASGVMLAVSKTITVPQTILLDPTKIFAVCYAETDGTNQDLSWRDAYIRLTISKLETVTSVGVTHRTTGQIADNAALPLTYTGSLQNGQYISIVQADLNMKTIGWGGPSPPPAATFPFPCADEATAEAGTDAQHTGPVQAGLDNKIVNVNTQDLQRATSQLDTTIQTYAICYTDGNITATSTNWQDSGIRVTITEVYEVLFASGHTGPPTKADTMPRHMSSNFLSTNRLPQAAAQTLTYRTHATSTLTEYSSIEYGNQKWLSVVDASLNGADPCVVGTVAAAAADSLHSGAQQAGATDKAVSIPQDTLLMASNLGVEKEYAVCYAKETGLFNDASWRDSYIRLRISKVVSIAALGTVHKTVGQIPNTAAVRSMQFTYEGSLAGSTHLSLVNSAKNDNFPCAKKMAEGLANTILHTPATAADCATSATCTTGEFSGVHQGSAGKVVTTFDTTGLSTAIHFALCYAENGGSNSDTSWTDSGIRLTVPKVHSVTYDSGYEGAEDRVMTSYPSATNRLPRKVNVQWTYNGDMVVNKHISIVSAALNNGNACLNPAVAGQIATYGGFNANEKRYSGTVTGGSTDKLVTIPQATNELLYAGTLTTAHVFAVCYSDGDGSATDNNWRDTYVRVKTSEIDSFITKEVTHRTVGQIPSHPVGLTYVYSGSLPVEKYVSLVDASLGTQSSTGFATAISNPCECADAACTTLATGSLDTLHTGKAKPGAADRSVSTIATTQLLTTKSYALCYSSDSTVTQHTGNFFDSGIRLTIPKLTGVQYSGYSLPVATPMNKPSRLIKSVLAALQPTNEIVANVLPQMPNLPFVYHGDLANSMYVSIVAVDDAINNKNPCVDPTIASAAADGTHSGANRACLSYENLCTPIGVGSDTSGNREVIVPQNTLLDTGKTFTICYAEGLGDGFDFTWRDSYIRVTMSAITSIVASGVTHSDHGNIGSHEADVALQMTYDGALGNGYHISLVDETLNNKNPCISNAVAGSADDAAHSGPSSAGTLDKIVPVTTSPLSTTIQFAVCYTLKDEATFSASTWFDSGIRMKTSKINVFRYNNAQAPVGQFRRDHKAAKSVLATGISGYETQNLHTFMHKIPMIFTGTVDYSYIGDLPITRHVSLVATDINYGNPCGIASVASGSADHQRSGPVTATVATRNVAFSSVALQGLNLTKTFTLCYAESVSVPTTDPTYTGMGHIPEGWRDSYIRFTPSKIDYITSHQVQHRTQGHLPNLNQWGITYSGDIADNWYLSLVKASLNANDPCGDSSIAAQVPGSDATGATKATLGTKQVVLDTSVLDTAQNYAVCYSEYGLVTSSWSDSGIRVTISKVTSLTYNNAQAGTTATGQYAKLLTASNLYPASDTVNLATNRIPQSTNVDFIYDNGLGVSKYISFVDASLNSNNPCASATEAAKVADGTHSGPKQDATAVRTITTAQVLTETAMFAVCYSDGAGDISDVNWRDSFIRLRVSKVQAIKTYGIQHVTTGMVAARPALRFITVGTLGPTKLLTLVDEALNDYQPCIGAHAGIANATFSGVQSYAGLSTDNIASVHTLKTDLLSADKTFALCYADGTGDTSDATWADSGMRLQTPKVTMISYMQPARELTATTCFGDIDLWGPADCRWGAQGAGLTASITTTAARNSQLPQATQVVITYNNNDGTGVPMNNKYLSLVEHSRGSQAGNPCRDGNQAAAAANSAGSADARLHSGVIQAGQNDTIVTIPCETGGGTQENLLDFDMTFAVCYTEGDGTVNDPLWRDSYVRITLAKLHSVTASQMTVYTRGMFGNVPSLRVFYTGGIAPNKWLTIVDSQSVAYPSSPCDKTNAGAAAYHRPWTADQDSSSDTNLRTPTLQAGPASKMIDFDTSTLNGNGNLYMLCSANGDGTTTDASWMDTGIRLRFLKWSNAGKERLASGSASNLFFQINQGGFDPNTDLVVLLNSQVDCTNAPQALMTSNGNSVARRLKSDGSIQLPSGTGVTNFDADGWQHCTVDGVGGACEEKGAYGDLDLNEGPYVICFCDGDSGNGGCDTGNEFVKVSSPITGSDLKIIGKPRLGRPNGVSHLGSIRGITGKGHIYNVKATTSSPGYEVADGDHIFFREGSCASSPWQTGDGETAPMMVKEYDGVPTSSTYQAARFQTNSSLVALPNGGTRSLVACYATSQGLTHDSAANNYAQLDDGLEIIPLPRTGPVSSPGHIRSVTGGSPTIVINPFKTGDMIYFKTQTMPAVGHINDCLLGTADLDGVITIPIPINSSDTETTTILGHAFNADGSGKFQLAPLQQLTIDGYKSPRYMTACFIPAGAMERIPKGSNCPVDAPNNITNSNGGSCTLMLENSVRLQDDLVIFPEPTDALVNSWFVKDIFELRFNQPQWGIYGTKTFATGVAGDVVVLQKENCNNVHAINAGTYAVGGTNSQKMVLEEYGGEDPGSEQGGVASVKSIAFSKANELPVGIYKICYAPKNSEGDDENDYHMLTSMNFEILPPTATRPNMNVPRTVLLGQDIVVHWTSTVNLQTKLQSQNSWIGLYHNGTCMPSVYGSEWRDEQHTDFRNQILNTQAEAPVSGILSEYIEHEQHECYVAQQFIAGGVEAGTVRFRQEEYKNGGTYQVRFFQGDSRNAQGRVCRGLTGAPHETYINCHLESAHDSDPIEVLADRARMDDLDAIPGMEVLFNGNRGRYTDTSTGRI